MKSLFILVFVFGITSMNCSEGGSSNSVNVSPTPRQVLPTTTEPQVVVTPTSHDANKNPHVIKGGPLCENYLSAKASRLRSDRNKLVKLKDFGKEDETLLPGLKKWLETADPEKLLLFELKNNERTALILASRNIDSTGLASNLEYWAIGLDNNSIEFRSLSSDPRLIFWDKDGLLNYYVVDYSDQFVEEKDFNNLSLNLQLFKVNVDGKPVLVDEEKNVRCK